MAKVKRTVLAFICERCGHEWIPRDPDDPPRRCPSCKSPYWDRPRQNPKPKKRRKKASPEQEASQ